MGRIKENQQVLAMARAILYLGLKGLGEELVSQNPGLGRV
jgi:hypothetical protein